MKQKPVVLKFPVPSVDEFARRLGISRKHQAEIERIMREPKKRKK